MTEMTNAKVFVGRLPDGCTAKDLEDLFTMYGTVDHCDVIGKYGFVHMIKSEDANEAIKKLNNYNFMGSQLTVQFSTSKKKDGLSGKVKKQHNSNRGKRNSCPYRNNYQSGNRSLPPHPQPYDPYGPPQPPPARYGPYYNDRNNYNSGPYRDAEPFYRDVGDGMPPVPNESPIYGRRHAPQAQDYPRLPPPDFYDRRESQYSRPYEMSGPVRPIDNRAIGFGGPSRNGFGNIGYNNRGGASGQRLPVPAPSARWQPF